MNFTCFRSKIKLFLFDNELHLETCQVIVFKLLVLIDIDVNQKRHLCLIVQS